MVNKEVTDFATDLLECEKAMVERDQLMKVGNLYTMRIIRGKGSRTAKYKNVYASSKLNADIIGSISLKTEPFVFLESVHIPNWWSTYKVLTSKGLYGWLQVGAEDRAYKAK